MTQELTINVKQVYGNDTIYPACSNSLLLASFKNQKTFTTRDITILKKLGYSFKLASSYQHLMGTLEISGEAY